MKVITQKIFAILLIFMGLFSMNAQAQGDCTCPKVLFKSGSIGDAGPDSYKATISWRAPEGVENPKYNIYAYSAPDVTEGHIIAREITETSYQAEIWYNFPTLLYIETVCEDGGTSYPVFAGILDYPQPQSMPELSGEAVTLYPNPASSVVSISGNDIVKAEIYNALGQLMKIESGKSMHSVDVSSLAEGVYLVKLYDFYGNIVNKPIVVAR